MILRQSFDTRGLGVSSCYELLRNHGEKSFSSPNEALCMLRCLRLKGKDGSSLGNSVHFEREILQFAVSFDLENDCIASSERAGHLLKL